MMNGDGNGPSGEDTPNERPEPTLPEHRGYVLALLSAATALHGTAVTFQEIAHELRIARDPIGPGTRARIKEAFKAVRNTGDGGERAFDEGGE